MGDGVLTNCRTTTATVLRATARATLSLRVCTSCRGGLDIFRYLSGRFWCSFFFRVIIFEFHVIIFRFQKISKIVRVLTLNVVNG